MDIHYQKIGIIAAALADEVRESVRLARVYGFGGVLLDAYSSRLALPELSVSGRRELRHVLASQERALIGVRVELGAKGIGPGADVEWALGRLERGMEAAAGLGAPLVCVDIGPLPPPPKTPQSPPEIPPEMAGLILIPPPKPKVVVAEPGNPEAEAAISGVLIELGRSADRYGVTVAMRSELSSFEALARAIGSARCPWFGVDLDPAGMVRDEWSMDEVFSRLGPLVRHVRGRDAIGGQDRRTKPAVIGRGSVRWEELLADLDAAGYQGWITVDPVELTQRVDAAVLGREYLRGA